MVGFVRLVVCGGLFVAGYYLGRQSCRLEMELRRYQQEDVEKPGSVSESDSVKSGARGSDS